MKFFHWKIINYGQPPVMPVSSLWEMCRLQVGQPYSSFFGLKHNGVFQNQTEINSYRNAKDNYSTKCQTGDFRWVDTNGDGVIDNNDILIWGTPFLNLLLV
jgi:hypothetical protein